MMNESLYCVVVAHPAAGVEWVDHRTGNRTKGVRLQMTRYGSAVYECIANNSVGLVRQNITAIVTDGNSMCFRNRL